MHEDSGGSIPPTSTRITQVFRRNKMNTYIVSTVLVKDLKNGQTNISNSILEVTTVSEDEAKGKAFTQVSKDFPEHQINTMLAVLVNANPWQQAIDDGLVNAHLGIAKDEITREEAKAQLNNLIAWHIDAAKYFDSQAQQKCSCVYATARNTPAVKAGYEMGGYVKNVCAYCQSQAQQEPLKVSENWREPLSADAMQRLKNLGLLDKSPAPEGGIKMNSDERIAELEQAASINQEYVTEMHRINGMAISAGLEVPNPNSPYFSERSAIAYLQRQSYEQGWKDGNNNVKLMDHKD